MLERPSIFGWCSHLDGFFIMWILTLDGALTLIGTHVEASSHFLIILLLGRWGRPLLH